jgi:uncharacterized RDD family membrane protein YckC
VPLDGPTPEYVTPITRFGVHLLDCIFFILGALPVGIPPAIAFGFQVQQGGANVTFMLIGFGISALYMLWWFYYYQVGRICNHGATWGMRLGKVRLVTQAGGPISFGRALGRFFMLLIVLNTPLLFGQISCFFDPMRRTVHDMICGTCMIKSR